MSSAARRARCLSTRRLRRNRRTRTARHLTASHISALHLLSGPSLDGFTYLYSLLSGCWFIRWVRLLLHTAVRLHCLEVTTVECDDALQGRRDAGGWSDLCGRLRPWVRRRIQQKLRARRVLARDSLRPGCASRPLCPLWRAAGQSDPVEIESACCCAGLLARGRGW